MGPTRPSLLRLLAVAAAAQCACGMNDYSQPGPLRVGWRKILVKPANALQFESMAVYPAAELGWEVRVGWMGVGAWARGR